jgi:transcription antitermination factor NusG
VNYRSKILKAMQFGEAANHIRGVLKRKFPEWNMEGSDHSSSDWISMWKQEEALGGLVGPDSDMEREAKEIAKVAKEFYPMANIEVSTEMVDNYFYVNINTKDVTDFNSGQGPMMEDPEEQLAQDEMRDVTTSYRQKITTALKKKAEDEGFRKGSMVKILRDIKNVKAGSKGLVQWVGNGSYMVIISPTNEYSVSRAGHKYIKDGIKIYANPVDLESTSMENSWKPYKREEPEMVGDWDDKQPNETWEEFKERMWKAGRDVGD